MIEFELEYAHLEHTPSCHQFTENEMKYPQFPPHLQIFYASVQETFWLRHWIGWSFSRFHSNVLQDQKYDNYSSNFLKSAKKYKHSFSFENVITLQEEIII